jgi:hypothetical protein
MTVTTCLIVRAEHPRSAPATCSSTADINCPASAPRALHKGFRPRSQCRRHCLRVSPCVKVSTTVYELGSLISPSAPCFCRVASLH